eukprot:6998284-Ditylum_brightwellii.AAC.1
MPLTCLWSLCIFWWFAAHHALMGEVKATTTVTSWWIGAMLEQLWRLVPWRRVQRLLVYITQSAAMRFGRKKPGKSPRPKTGRPVRGWWTPYIFAYNRLTNLIKMPEDIRMGLKGVFGQKSSYEKKSRKN